MTRKIEYEGALAFCNGALSYKFPDEEIVAETVVRPPCKEEVDYWKCDDCGQFHSRPHTCNELYCKKCYEQKRKKYYARLMEKEITIKRFIHVALGYPNDHTDLISHDDRKRKLESVVNKTLRQIRKEKGLKMQGFRIYDLADDGNYGHFHFGLLPERGFMNGRSLNIDVDLIRKYLKKYSDGKINFIKIIGFRKKSSLFGYFSKRLAGRYGHGKKSFFLEDVMEYVDYREYFHNKRKLVWVGSKLDTVGVSCNIAQSKPNCPYCGSENVRKLLVGSVDYEEFVKMGMELGKKMTQMTFSKDRSTQMLPVLINSLVKIKRSVAQKTDITLEQMSLVSGKSDFDVLIEKKMNLWVEGGIKRGDRVK